MSRRSTLALGSELKVQTRVTVLNPAVSVCLPALQLNPAKICSRPGSVNGFSSCVPALKKAKALCVSLQKCSNFKPPLKSNQKRKRREMNV